MSTSVVDPADGRDLFPYESSTPSTPGHAAQHAPPPQSAAGPLKQLLLRMHFFAGVLVGPFLLVTALSGALYAIAPTVEQVVYGTELTAASPEQSVPLDAQVASARALHPDLMLAGVVAGSKGATTRVLFTDPALSDALSSSYSRVVFVDPSSGDVRGDTVQYGSSQSLPLRTWISELHRSLHLGEPGRLYSELAASWLAPIALGGLVMWWIQRRRQGRRASLLRSGRREVGRSRTRTRHAVAGTWVVAGLVFLSATGLTWSQFAGANVSDLRAAMNWVTPTLTTGTLGSDSGTDHADAEGHEEHGGTASTSAGDAGTGTGTSSGAGHGGHTAAHRAVGVDGVLSGARAAGLQDPMTLTPPTEAGASWLVAETRRSWTAGPDSVTIDSSTGEVVEHQRFADFPVAAKFADWGIRAHMGILFGLANQLLLVALALVLVGVILRGYAMWWARRPGPGRPPMRGALRQLARRRPVVTAIGLFVVATVGWFVPLLGVSLVVFLVTDGLLGWWHGQRGSGHR